MNIEQYSPQSGRFLKEDGTYINIADALGGTETGQIADIEKHAAHSGRFIKEDGTCVNIADMIANGDIGGGGGGSSDDSATPIIEEYNGQVIRSFMSADRPLKGLNLYATCKQDSTSGAQLLNFTENTVTANGITCISKGSTITINGERVGGDGGRTKYTTSTFTLEPGTYSFSSEIFNDVNSAVMTVAFTKKDGNEILNTTFTLEEETNVYIGINMLEGKTADNAIIRCMLNKGESALPYEPYTGGIPSPNGDYPQEIQVISDFVVEVKNSMGEVATPQTLNVAIPEQGFYGIPVKSRGNYTDSTGQQWICDEFDYKRGKYIQRVRKVILNGSENEGWKHYASSPSKLAFVAYRTFEGAKKVFETSICNMFINKPRRWDNNETWVYSDHNLRPEKYFNIPKVIVNTLEEWKTWLSTHPLEVLYLLETPVEYDLTNEQVEQFKKLKSYYGTTYIDNDAVPACNMQAELVLDTKLYIDSKFTTLVGQILEMGV